MFTKLINNKNFSSSHNNVLRNQNKSILLKIILKKKLMLGVISYYTQTFVFYFNKRIIINTFILNLHFYNWFYIH